MTATASLATPRDFSALYDAHASDVLRIASSVLNDRQLAEDVTHDVFLRLWRRPESFDPSRGDIATFLRGMARNGAIDAWRKAGSARRMRERLERDAPMAPPAPETATIAERTDAAAMIRGAVRRLPETQREVIALAYWGGLSASEISRNCDVPLGTVKSRMRAGLQQLRTELDGGPELAPA